MQGGQHHHVSGGQCVIPTVRGGFWTCTTGFASNRRRRADGDDEGADRGGYGNHNGYNGLVKQCKLTCNHGWQLVGSASAHCHSETGYWSVSATGYCKELIACQDLRADHGTYTCSGPSHKRTCSLKCPRYWNASNGKYKYNCHEGRWDGHTDCQFVNKCQEPIRGENYQYVCHVKNCETHDTLHGQQKGKPNKYGHGHKGKREAEEFEGEPAYRGYVDHHHHDQHHLAGPDQCMVCFLKCDPLHRGTSGYRAQCSLMDGRWFEKAIGTCKFEHHCFWPQAGPMGCYNCHDNLIQMGYHDHGHSVIPNRGQTSGHSHGGSHGHGHVHRNGTDRDVVDGIEEVQDEEVILRKKRAYGHHGSHHHGTHATSSVTHTQKVTQITQIVEEKVEVYHAWWDSKLTCQIECARFHKPSNGNGHAHCTLKNGAWSPRPAECVYHSPCNTPTTPHGVFQCWEQTILPEDVNKAEVEVFTPGQKIVVDRKRRDTNETEFINRGMGETFNPFPHVASTISRGQWGLPQKPSCDRKYWDFSVKRECMLTCNECYSPSSQRAVCINGIWLDGYKPGKCEAWEHCPAEPWWDPGHGYWMCTSNGRYRTCNLQCQKYYIGAQIMPPLNTPPEHLPAITYGICKAIVSIKNGYMKCNTKKRPYQCRIMCYEGFAPSSKKKLTSTCDGGKFYPSRPEKNEQWECNKDNECKANVYGESCWGVGNKYDEFSSYLHSIGVDNGDTHHGHMHGGHHHGRKRREDEESTDINRYGPQGHHHGGNTHAIKQVISLTSRCDNCHGIWRNQVHCVFNTRCMDVPPIINNAYVECQRVMGGEENSHYHDGDKNKHSHDNSDHHVCMVQCHKNYQIVKGSCHISQQIQNEKEDYKEGDNKNSNKKGKYRREADETAEAASEDEEGDDRHGGYGNHHHAPAHHVNIHQDGGNHHHHQAAHSHAQSHFSHSQSSETVVQQTTNVVQETHTHHHHDEVVEVVHHHHVQVVGIIHEEEVDINAPSPPGAMKCDARTGDWDAWCRCEWKLTCQKPTKPNAKYECWEENGLYVCQLTCKGNGQFVPAKWREQWTFKCKRGIWIEREPQGCAYEPPCKVPNLPNALITGCKKEKCMAPLKAYREEMPGQKNYKKKVVHVKEDMASHSHGSGHTHGSGHGGPGHIGYHGRKRRQAVESDSVDTEIQPDGTVDIDESGDYMEFFYVGGVPVFNPVEETDEAYMATEADQQPWDSFDSEEKSEPTIGRFLDTESDRGQGHGKDPTDKNHHHHSSNSHNKKQSHSYTGFGTCMSRRQVVGGFVHCHSIGAYHPVLGHEHMTSGHGHGYGGHGNNHGHGGHGNTHGHGHAHGHGHTHGTSHIAAADTSGGHTHIGGINDQGHAHGHAHGYGNRGEVDSVETCRTRHNVNNGWLECRSLDNGWVCRVRCNKGMHPTSRNQFTKCNDGKMSRSLQCTAGPCDPSVYKAACWAGARTRREDDTENDDTIYEADEDAEGQRSLARAYGSHGSHQKPIAHAHYAWCELICNPGYQSIGQRSFKCTVATGQYEPKIQGCRRVAKAPVKYTTETKVVVDGNVWATCVCCNVKCQNWYKGGGFAKCVKGYWFHKDKCSKYNGCNKPASPPHGEYSCVYEHEWLAESTGQSHGHSHGRKRRHDDGSDHAHNDDGTHPTTNDGYRSDVWEGNEETYSSQLRSIESDLADTGDEMEGGYRWGNVQHKKMLCSLSCAEGHTAVRPMSICVDGVWIIPPSYCKEDHKCQPPAQDAYGSWSCRVEVVGGHHSHGNYAPSHGHGHSHGATHGATHGHGGGHIIGHGATHGHAHGHAHGRKRRHSDGNEHVHNTDGSITINTDGTIADRGEFDDYTFDDYVSVNDYFNIDGFKAMGQDANNAAGSSADSGDRSEGDESQSDRWENMNARKMLVCRLNCYDGTYNQGSYRAMCDMSTGFWYPTPGTCKAFDGQSSVCSQPIANHGHYDCHRVNGAPHAHKSHGGAGHHHGQHSHGPCPARITVQNGFTQCKQQGHGYFCMLMCHKGYKPATRQTFSGCSNGKLAVANMRCVHGYCDPNVYRRSCFGVTMDNDPGHHHHNTGHTHNAGHTHNTGHNHNAGHGHNGHIIGHKGESDRVVNIDGMENVDDEELSRKRRHDDGSEHEHNSDGSISSNSTDEADEFGDVWFTKSVGRLSYSQTHLVCDLNCAPGMTPLGGSWVAKCDEKDGSWVVPPTHCDNTNWTPKCNQKQVNGGYITCGHQNSGHQYSTSCHLHCHPGFSPRDPHRTSYTCNFGSGAFSPQPIGCRPDHLPEHPHSCAPPSNLGGGAWKCFLQDYDAPYPTHSRTDEWDTIKHVIPPKKRQSKPGRRRRHDDGTEHVHNEDESIPASDYFSDEQKMVKSEHENKHTKVIYFFVFC